MKTDEKGFGVVTILVVLVIVGLVGAVSWLVYDRQNSKSNQEQIPASQTETQAPQNQIDQIETKHNTIESGIIKGKLGYPSSGNPAQNVCAVSVTNEEDAICVSTSSGQNAYSIKVKPGDYYVYSSLKKTLGDFTPNYKAYYNEFSKCGNSVNCPKTGHKQYIKVTVGAGKTVDNVDPTDWYAK